MSHNKKFPPYRWLVVHLILLAAVVIAGCFVTNYLGERARREIFDDNKATTLLLTTHLTGELRKIEGAVKAMAGSPWIVWALTSRRDKDIAQANSALDRYKSALDVSVSYIMDVDGVTIASSNRNDLDSFVGKSYHFRPYFIQAVAGNPGRYFGLGITSFKRGFYASFPVRGFEGEIIGVVVMKKDLDGMELQLRNYPHCFFVNKNGVIFLSSDPALVMKSLWPIDKATQESLFASKQFGEKHFEAVVQEEVMEGSEIILEGNAFLASRKFIDPAGWSIVHMTPTDRITMYKSVGVILTFVACLLIIIPLVITYQAIRSAEAIRRSEERFEQVAQNSQDWIWETDRNGRYTYSSQAVKNILGYDPEEIVGMHYYDLYIPHEKEELKRIFKGFFDRKESFFRIVNRRVHRDGHLVFVESTGVPLFDSRGRVTGYRGTNRDITGSKELEEKLRGEEQRMRRIIQGSPIPAFVIGKDHRVIYWNRALGEITGISEEEVAGTTLQWRAFYGTERPCMADLLVDEAIDLFPRWYSDKFNKSKLLEEAFEGTDFFPELGDGGKWLHFTAAAIRDVQGNVLGAIETLEDITERRYAEDALRFTQFSVDHINDSLFWTTPDARFFSVNHATCRNLGYTREELLSLTVYDIDPNFTKEIWDNHWRELKVNRLLTFESMHRRKDGTLFPVASNANFLEIEGREYCLVFARDITERKKAEEEKEKLEKGLIQAQKMEAIGTLAGGIAHDFNNLLMGIQGYASLMLLTTGESHPNYNKLKSIEEQVKSGADLTAQLLGFARGGRYEIKPVDVNALIKSTTGMFGRTKKEILIHYKLREDLWPAEVDRGQIEQVLLNLYVNAWQAMPKGGDLYLETDNTILDENYLKHFSVTSGRYVKISVTDTGIGMDEKTQERIFEPFFTTKEMGRGTGLGLATVYGIIKGHKGVINVYSEKGHGTTFTIYLPATDKEVSEERGIQESLQKGHETILLVDDEEVILSVSEEILKSLGYNVLTARSGREAIELYKTAWGNISLVILDMIMPETGGGETFDGLKEINPDVKVILSSGYSLNGQAIRIMERGCCAFIQKPFTISSLAQKIRDVLDGHLET